MASLVSPPLGTERCGSRCASKLFQKASRDYTQRLRHAFQLAFLALNAWIGFEFYQFVRYYESGGRTVWTARPPGIEGWLPIASLMNLKLWLLTGKVPLVHAAGMFLLIAFLAMSWIFRKSFCSWLCPVGSISEYLASVGKRALGRNFRLPRPADIALRGLKYLLLSFFLYVIGSMAVSEIRAFLAGPYGLIDDVKMLNFFRFPGLTSGLVLALLVLASLFVENFWCRYLCPYGALMGLIALPSPVRIRRVDSLCIDCGKCARACPSALPVDRLVTIRSAECTSCLECVAACPAAGALFLAAPRAKRIPGWAMAAGVALVFIGITVYAKATGHWRTDLPSQIYFELIPQANDLAHP